MNSNHKGTFFLEKILTALTVAPTLAVVIFSAAYYLMCSSLGQKSDDMFAVILACLSLLTLAASTTLALLYKRKFVTVFLSAVFFVCFIFYLIFTVSGTTNVFSDTFFEKLMIIFAFPVSSYYALAAKLFGSGAQIASLVITGIISAVNIVSSVIISKAGKKNENG